MKKIVEMWEIPPFLEWRKKKGKGIIGSPIRNAIRAKRGRGKVGIRAFVSRPQHDRRWRATRFRTAIFMPYSVLFPVGRHDPRARIGDEGFSICRWRSGHDKDRDSALASVRDPIRNRLFVAGWISI